MPQLTIHQQCLLDLLEQEVEKYSEGASLRTHGYNRAPAVLERRGQIERGYFEGGGFRMRLTFSGRGEAWQIQLPLKPKQLEVFNTIVRHCKKFGVDGNGRLNTRGLGRVPWGLQTKGLCVVEKMVTSHAVGLTELGWKRAETVSKYK